MSHSENTSRRSFLTSSAIAAAALGTSATVFSNESKIPVSDSVGLVNITEFGADKTGQALSTNSFQQAIDQLSKAGGGTVFVPAGRFKTGTVYLKNNVNIYLDIGAIWFASDQLEHFDTMTWGHNKDRQPWHMIYADNVDNVAITGLGTIDGNGEKYWQAYEKDVNGNMVIPRWIKAKDKKLSPLIDINNSRNIKISGVTIKTGGGWCVHCFDCDYVSIDNVKIMNNIYSPNSDGIDLSGCRDVAISDCHIVTCDDAIVLKTLPDSRTCERVAVNNCVIETLCVGIKMGANESFQDMRDFSATNCVFTGTSRFFALYSKQGKMLENISISNITGNTNAKLVFNRPIQLMVAESREGEVGGIKNVVVNNMNCHTDGRILMTCDPGGVLDNITLRDVTMTYPWVEDPKPINAGARSNQFPSQQHHKDANEARAAIVAKNLSRLNIQNVVANWPDKTKPVAKEWQHKERIENGTTRIHSYDYSNPQPAPFHFLWTAKSTQVINNSPFGISSEPGVRTEKHL